MTTDSVQQLARAALDGLTVRQQMTAHNIANQATPGFSPWRVDFETAWREAVLETPQNPRLPALTMHREPVASVQLDLELSRAAETATRYSALVESVDRLLGLQAMAIRGD
jgi:flagellar basal-body rod protein FlgB